MESKRISKKLLGNLLGKLGIFFENAPGIPGETLGAFGGILVKVSLLKRASRSYAKTGFLVALKALYLLWFRHFSLKLGFPMCPKRNKGSQLSAWEAKKHCACAQIQA
jgi:hypothetical protein